MKKTVDVNFSMPAFYRELEQTLATSDGAQRKKWAATIIEKDLSLEVLAGLLQCDRKVATRFLWLLSDVGIANPDKLLAGLPFLFDVCGEHPVYKAAFASFWLYAGVPPENEGRAIDLLFHLFRTTDTTVTIKSRALAVLFQLTQKYPELKNELRSCIDEQIDHHSNDFKKRAASVRRAITD